MLLTAAAVALTASSAAAAGKRMTAVRVDAAPTIDGVLDEDAWKKAAFVSDFKQLEPTEGAEPTDLADVTVVLVFGADPRTRQLELGVTHDRLHGGASDAAGGPLDDAIRHGFSS